MDINCQIDGDRSSNDTAAVVCFLRTRRKKGGRTTTKCCSCTRRINTHSFPFFLDQQQQYMFQGRSITTTELLYGPSTAHRFVRWEPCHFHDALLSIYIYCTTICSTRFLWAGSIYLHYLCRSCPTSLTTAGEESHHY